MIVQCSSCQTKFRVPDEKIGEKPVKVRCSKCQNVFGVKRGPDGSAVAASLPGAKAPPAAPAPPPAAEPPPQDPFAAFGPPPAAPPGESTVPGVWHGGIAASRRDSENTRPAPAEDSDATRPRFALNALIASKLDLGSPAPNTALPGPDPFSTPPLPTSPTDPFAQPPAGAAADPFANLDPVGATLASGAAPAALPFPEAPAADPFANLDLSAAPPPAAPAALPAADPFANLDLGAVAGPSASPDLAAPALAAPAAEPADGPLSFSFESPGAPAAAAAPAASADDFFGQSEPENKPRSSVGFDAFGPDETTQTQPAGEPDRSLFDLPAPPPPSAPSPSLDELVTVPPAAPDRPAPVAKPARPATTGIKPAAVRKPLGQRVMGAVLNVLFVLAVGWGSLLAYASARADWHFDPALLRPAELGRAVFGSRGAAAQLALEDVSSGSYERADGRSAFYVRGELVNRGKAPLGPARAKVDLLEGDRVLASTEAWAGQAVTPEQVYDLGNAKQLEALQAQARSAARPLAPGEARPFVAVMLDVPESSASRSVRIVPDLGGAR